jgi:cytidine deaminase
MTAMHSAAQKWAWLIKEAHDALKMAYAPYSRYRVGAALLTEKGKVYKGCNVENASYGLTICAERAAVCAAVAQEGGETLKIKALAVVNEAGAPCAPCGACRQVLLEFGPEAVVIYRGSEGLREATAAELLPQAFALAGK